MKVTKSIIVVVLCAAGFLKSHAQNNWNLDFNLGALTSQNYNDFGMTLSSNVSYLIPVSKNIQIGPAVGYSRLILFEDDVNFLPIAISGRVDLSNRFLIGLDMGYSIEADEILEGGFYYRPKIMYQFSRFNLVGSYVGITQNSGSISTVNIGAEIKL